MNSTSKPTSKPADPYRIRSELRRMLEQLDAKECEKRRIITFCLKYTNTAAATSSSSLSASPGRSQPSTASAIATAEGSSFVSQIFAEIVEYLTRLPVPSRTGVMVILNDILEMEHRRLRFAHRKALDDLRRQDGQCSSAINTDTFAWHIYSRLPLLVGLVTSEERIEDGANILPVRNQIQNWQQKGYFALYDAARQYDALPYPLVTSASPATSAPSSDSSIPVANEPSVVNIDFTSEHVKKTSLCSILSDYLNGRHAKLLKRIAAEFESGEWFRTAPPAVTRAQSSEPCDELPHAPASPRLDGDTAISAANTGNAVTADHSALPSVSSVHSPHAIRDDDEAVAAVCNDDDAPLSPEPPRLESPDSPALHPQDIPNVNPSTSTAEATKNKANGRARGVKRKEQDDTAPVGSLLISKEDIERHLEDDRDRYKRYKEDQWRRPVDETLDSEFDDMWENTESLSDDDMRALQRDNEIFKLFTSNKFSTMPPVSTNPTTPAEPSLTSSAGKTGGPMKYSTPTRRL
ncbi:hypothetical protein GQ42DRAFT_177186 [Ramicandelaber brevisporus]|nr:hypothetical protein GQ42DRAFT_177186 [Ramicandelaber brevisporus]